MQTVENMINSEILPFKPSRLLAFEKEVLFMSDKLIRSLSSQIAEELVRRKLPSCPNKKAAQALLRNMDFTQAMSALLPLRERISPTVVLEMCAPVLD